MEAKALHYMSSLLDKATDKHETHPSPAILKQVRDFCKESDANILWVSGVLLHRLSDDHAQVLLYFLHNAVTSSSVRIHVGSCCNHKLAVPSHL